MVWFNTFCIMLIAVIIIDYSDFIESIKMLIKKILKIKTDITNITIKPFDCSFCMSFWLNVLYLCVNHCLTVPNIAYVLLLSALTVPTFNLLCNVIETLNKWINKIN